VIAYVDSSVLLRMILGEPTRLKEWDEIRTSVASSIAEIECLRTLDRFRLLRRLPDDEIVGWRDVLYRLMARTEIVEVDRSVVARASQPFTTILRTLDAIHLASAMVWREHSEADLTMATHDGALAKAARAHGFSVVGI
jgi:predicted nucleic acid-binding protein